MLAKLSRLRQDENFAAFFNLKLLIFDLNWIENFENWSNTQASRKVGRCFVKFNQPIAFLPNVLFIWVFFSMFNHQRSHVISVFKPYSGFSRSFTFSEWISITFDRNKSHLEAIFLRFCGPNWFPSFLIRKQLNFRFFSTSSKQKVKEKQTI